MTHRPLGLVLSASCALAAVSCIPTPRFVRTDLGSRGSIAPQQLVFLQAGLTTRETVLLALGEPDFAGTDERGFFYYWTTAGGVWFTGCVSGGCGPSGYLRTQSDYLNIAFDQRGIVTEWRMSTPAR